jgi:hypothetical protein
MHQIVVLNCAPPRCRTNPETPTKFAAHSGQAYSLSLSLSHATQAQPIPIRSKPSERRRRRDQQSSSGGREVDPAGVESGSRPFSGGHRGCRPAVVVVTAGSGDHEIGQDRGRSGCFCFSDGRDQRLDTASSALGGEWEQSVSSRVC